MKQARHATRQTLSAEWPGVASALNGPHLLPLARERDRCAEAVGPLRVVRVRMGQDHALDPCRRRLSAQPPGGPRRRARIDHPGPQDVRVRAVEGERRRVVRAHPRYARGLAVPNLHGHSVAEVSSKPLGLATYEVVAPGRSGHVLAGSRRRDGPCRRERARRRGGRSRRAARGRPVPRRDRHGPSPDPDRRALRAGPLGAARLRAGSSARSSTWWAPCPWRSPAAWQWRSAGCGRASAAPASATARATSSTQCSAASPTR